MALTSSRTAGWLATDVTRGAMTIWRNETAGGRGWAEPRFASNTSRICSSVGVMERSLPAWRRVSIRRWP
jgi:hypothetical protein